MTQCTTTPEEWNAYFQEMKALMIKWSVEVEDYESAAFWRDANIEDLPMFNYGKPMPDVKFAFTPPEEINKL